MSGPVSKYILDTTQNNVKVPYLKGFKKRSAFRLLKHISNSLFELCVCNFVGGCVSKYILDTTQNSVKVPYLKVFKIQSA